MSWSWLEDEIERLDKQQRLRHLQDTVALDDGYAWRGGKKLLNLASNDYLGLASQEFTPANDEGWGAAASRLVTGTYPLISEFEEQFADFKQTESVLLFNSGYTANVGVIAALCRRGDVVYSDRLNHASIVDGILLSRSELVRYRHRDLDELEHLLKQQRPGRNAWIVSDTIFSMDGSVAPLSELVRLKEKYGAILMVDEAHSGGVYGDAGQGLTHRLGLSEFVDLQMGTFSKAYGRFGAYLACSANIKQYLLNKARSFVYTTALPPVMVASIRQNWQLVKNDHWRRHQVHDLAARFRSGLKELGLDSGESESQIVPLILGSDVIALKWQNLLQENGILAVAIRPPTVPEGTARIRFSWSAAHRTEEVARVLGVIRDISQEVPPHV